ncbi:Required for respiratory growth protein 9 mitochondrial [Collariella sp. IMI 366227]|nr:Required for respiratory growth protein 9 mitochondrial [Collariella sp. IMI 366227]
MDCSCRTAALRIFVKSIAQVHTPLRTTTPRIAQQAQALRNQPTRFSNPRAPTVLSIASSRSLHSSCVRRNAAEAAPAEASPRQSEPTSEPSSESTPGDSQAPVKKRRDRPIKAEKKQKMAAREESKGLRKEWKERGGKKDWKETKVKAANTEPRKFGLDPVLDTELPVREDWRIQKQALKEKFPEGWNPRKKLSPDALLGIRALHNQFPEEYTTEVLSNKFEVSPEAIRRILKSKWTPEPDVEIDRQERWSGSHWAALGKKPPRKWRNEGIVRDPVWNEPRGPRHKDPRKRADLQRKSEARKKRGMFGSGTF